MQRLLRDQLSPEYRAIRLDNEAEFATVLDFVSKFQPALVNRVKLHLKDTPIFEEYGLNTEIEKALRPKVWLKSGGYIVINQTEALVAIDVNTGKYVGKSNRLEDTIVRTNVDAVHEIVRQIRLRNLGGIIVVDFIDMEEKKNRQRVMAALEEAVRADRVPSKILQFNDFGLVAITRKRTQPSLEAHVVPSMSGLQRFGLDKVAGNDLLRNSAGDQENGAPVRQQGNHGARESRNRKGAEKRRIRFSERYLKNGRRRTSS